MIAIVHTLPRPNTGRVDIDRLSVGYRRGSATVRAVDDVSLAIEPGEAIGIVGESGSGKSTLVMAAAGLLDRDRANVTAARIAFGGTDLSRPGAAENVLGQRIGVIFQNPGTSLNPVLTIGRQLTDHMRVHLGIGRDEADLRAIRLLGEVGITDPERRLPAYPNEFSGGMLQRVMIAMALACDPDLLIADEPTTALDATIQAEVVDLVAEIRARRGLTLIWITHDLGVLTRVADRVAVMYAGRIVEIGPLKTVFHSPRHPYTRALLACMQSLWSDSEGDLQAIPGQPPDLALPFAPCAFRPRCPRAIAACAVKPALLAVRGEPSHHVACFAVETG